MSDDEKKPKELNEEDLNAVNGGAINIPSKNTSILFFDEADAIFGKRTGVKTSNNKFSGRGRK